MYIVKSKDRVAGTTSSPTIRISQDLQGYWGLQYFTMTNSFYNITSSNKQFEIADSGGSVSVSLTPAYYNSTELASHLQTAINNVASDTWEVAFSDTTQKFTFTLSPSATLSINFGTNSSLKRILGFSDASNTDPSSIVSDNVVDVRTDKLIFVRVRESSNNPIHGSSMFNATFFFSLKGTALGETLLYNFEDNKDVFYLNLNDSKTLEFQFLDEDGNSLDLNGVEWLLILADKNV